MWFLLALLPVALGNPDIIRPGPDDQYFDVLEKDVREWRLVFRGQSGIAKSVYDAYVSGAGIPSVVPPACKGVDFKQPCTSHYRNTPALSSEWVGVRDVLFGIVKNGAMVKTIRFDGRDSDYMNWFNESKVLESCYPDLTERSHNYFSIEGDTKYAADGSPLQLRRFFINNKYGGCPNDLGWFVALDGPDSTRLCNWERDGLTFPVFKYSTGLTSENYNDAAKFENAEAIVVFVRYLDDQSMDQYFDLMNTGEKEYRLAFRGTAGISVPIYPAYLDGTGIPSKIELACTQVDWMANCSSHYRNDLAMGDWDGIEEVLVGIVDGGSMRKYLRFTGVNTTNMDYFNYTNVFDSCYEDLHDAQKQTFRWFSIEGLSSDTNQLYKRRFYIDQYYGSCSSDGGWLAVIDDALNPVCSWERYTSSPAILYSKDPRVTNWTTGAVGHADALVIFLKYKKMDKEMDVKKLVMV